MFEVEVECLMVFINDLFVFVWFEVDDFLF